MEPAGVVLPRGAEGPQPLPDRLTVQFERQCRGGGAERVFDHVRRRPAEGDRHLLEAGELVYLLAPDLDHRPVLGDDGATAGMPVGDDRRVLGILGDPDDRGVQTGGLGAHQRIVGVQHHPAVRSGGAQDDALDLGQTLHRLHAVQAQVVAADIDHDADVVALAGHPAQQDAAPRRLQHGDVEPRFAQHAPGPRRTRVVPFENHLALDEDADGRGPADLPPHPAQDVGDQPGRGRLAVGSGDGDDGNGAILVADHAGSIVRIVAFGV